MLSPRAPAAMNAPERPTVLYVDDDPMALRFYCGLLAPYGSRVRTARDGLESLALAQRGRPDAVRLDLKRRGLNGFDICQKFRANPTLQDFPIVLPTGWGVVSVVMTGRDTGAILTLQKSTDAETVIRTVETVLRENGGPRTG